MKWEYMRFNVAQDDPAEGMIELNRLGSEGWQAFHYSPAAFGDGEFHLMKRPVLSSGHLSAEEKVRFLTEGSPGVK